MSDLDAQFTQAQADVKTLTERPSNADLLALYSLFKQATDGDASGKRPGMMDVAGRAKFDTWSKLAGTSADDAKQQYIDKVKGMMG